MNRLTLLIHLGYLTWCEETGTARIPNEEVRDEFRKILKGRNVSRKWIEQIKEKNYPTVIKDYGGEIILVGINYDEKTGKHSCLIEDMMKESRYAV